MAILDYVEWLEAGGMLVHSSCNRRAVRARESFSNSWGMPSFHCTYCRLDIGSGEVPEFKLGQRLPQFLDEETAELGELM